MNEEEYKIIEGAILSKFKVTDNDVILLTVDMNMFDINDAKIIFDCVTKTFPKNIILLKFKGIEIDKLKEKTLDEIK